MKRNKISDWGSVFYSVLFSLLLSIPFITPAQTSEFNYATGNVKGRNYVGGLTGSIPQAGMAVRNSYARGSVTGASYVGGLTGNNSGAVANSYSTGNVAGTSQTGGLIGSGTTQVTNSYWDIQTSGQQVSAGGTPRTTDPLTYPYSALVYSGWDFVSVWKADIDPVKNNGYPYLQPTSVFQVSLQVFPPGSGTATGQGYFKRDARAQLDAAPGSSYVFRGWMKNGAFLSNNPRYFLTVSENSDLVARFESKTTAVADQKSGYGHGIRIFPNPVKDILYVDIQPAGEKTGTVHIVNLTGQILKYFSPDQLPGERLVIPLSDLKQGVYMVVFSTSDGIRGEKFIKY